jgi:hypothetical protein
VFSAGATGDPGTPADASSGDLSRNGASISAIQPGAPGSVKSGGGTVGGPVGPPPAKPDKPAKEEESEGPDTGFSPALPYKQTDANADKEDGEAVGRVLVGLPEAIGADDTRRLLVPMAAGLLLFVFAMHALYAARRAAPEAPLETE